MNHEEDVGQFIDFMMERLDAKGQQDAIQAYMEWNRRPGGQLEGRPVPTPPPMRG